MRDTMRDDSIKRRPTRSVTRSQPESLYDKNGSRQDSLSSGRSALPVIRSLSASAASAALAGRTHEPESISSASSRSQPQSQVAQQNPLQARAGPDHFTSHVNGRTSNGSIVSDDGSLHSMSLRSKNTSESDESTSFVKHGYNDGFELRRPQNCQQPTIGSKRTTQIKDDTMNALRDYKNMWKDRQIYPSEEAIGWDAILKSVKKTTRSDGATMVATRRPSYEIPSQRPNGEQRHRFGSAAWPIGLKEPVDMNRRNNDGQSNQSLSKPVLQAPSPAYANTESVADTLGSTVTTFGDVIAAAMMTDDEHQTYSKETKDFTAPKYRATESSRVRNPEPIYLPEHHRFDPKRQSYSSSVYSQPSIYTPLSRAARLQDRPPAIPRIPGRFLQPGSAAQIHSATTPEPTASVDRPISSFFTPKARSLESPLEEERRYDWADKNPYDGGYGYRTPSPGGREESKRRPEEDGGEEGRGRGTLFYRHRDSLFEAYSKL